MKAILWQCENIFWVRPCSRLNKRNLSIKYIKILVSFKISSSEISFTFLHMRRMLVESQTFIRYSKIDCYSQRHVI